ncbi:tetratricopeptide repeat protein [Terracoccus luteus]|uniref:Tetratricopeptide (TPR) repeat protein n=1 Tax=Terracoccus luteus TaxID=53356 RepID=A0A839Q419_9MICO|nr:Replicase polyprotein 1ab [Terracoccus luteus]MBB2987882.1 tetratricopeptide (TPR) repeat protein [Terracoccus luteus]MCP2173533.1 tetratricopeptide (TPR) repeat protein [Terracoccus luteus]
MTGHEVDRGVKNQLRTLSKENAEGVAQHLVMVAELLDVDAQAALAHAETAVRRAGRVPAAREALGLVAYRLGDWARALGEFRTVRRLSGSNHLLPLMVDCERALGRHDKALELAQSPETSTLAIDDRVELAIVVSGIRRDLGQSDAAVAGLADLSRRISPNRPSAARLYYAYADAKLAVRDVEGAREWFSRAADADHELTTDAAERLDELDGVEVTDLLGDDDELMTDGDLSAADEDDADEDGELDDDDLDDEDLDDADDDDQDDDGDLEEDADEDDEDDEDDAEDDELDEGDPQTALTEPDRVDGSDSRSDLAPTFLDGRPQTADGDDADDTRSDDEREVDGRRD